MSYIRIAKRGEINPDIFITSGKAQLFYDNYVAADRDFQKALEIDPKNPIYNYFTGMNYISLDSPQKAQTFLNKAIKYGLSGELKSKAQNTLDSL